MTLREVGIDESRIDEMAHHVAEMRGLKTPGLRCVTISTQAIQRHFCFAVVEQYPQPLIL